MKEIWKFVQISSREQDSAAGSAGADGAGGVGGGIQTGTKT